MPTVTENVDLPDGTDPTRCTVEVQLYRADRTPLKEARDSVTGETVAGRRVITPDSTGAWSLVLTGNTNLVPAGSVWGRTLRGPRVDSTLSYATVAAAGGPYQWQQILTDPPAALAPAALEVGLATKVNRAGDTMTGPLIVDNDATIHGEILTGTFGSPATFTGIEREGRVFPAGSLASPTASMTFDDGVPRILLPPGITTNVYMTFALEEWWLDSSLGLYMEWTNDHTATSQNVRWQFELREYDIATQTLAAAGVIATKTVTVGAPPVNTPTTTICFSVLGGDNNIFFTPGPFASFYVLRMTRLGADVLDTLGGPVGIVEGSYVRGE